MSTIAPTQPATAPTQPATLPGAATPPPVSPELYRLSVEQYKRMGDAGILTDDDRVELVQGLLYRKPMKKGPHSIACRETSTALTRIVPIEGYFVTREDPVEIPGRADMPEPDISVVRGRSRDYTNQPGAGDVALIVEVADKGRLAFDRGEELGSYADGGIPVYWIVNLVDRQVEVYTGPGPGGYQLREDFKPGQIIPVVIDGRQLGHVAIDDILP
jgi:Uma2 family endonuclease